MIKQKDITGQKFGRLTAIKFINKEKNKNGKYRYYWLFKCDCGKEIILRKDCVIYKIKRNNIIYRGNTISCGCGFKHGMFGTRFYTIYHGIKNRCLNNKVREYKHYGARGIKVCDRWLNFENFRDDMYNSYLEHIKKYGEKNTTINRINNDGDYEINNCKWATSKEQANNTRRNHLLTFNNETLNISQWAKKLNFNYYILWKRINQYNWSIEKSLTTSVRILNKN